jgi:uncharacterized membrane protein YfcA
VSVNEWGNALLLGLAGFGCGFVNTLAGGGSLLTFPLLLWMGLSPQVANGTNRIGILLQCVAAILSYHRAGVFPWRGMVPLLASALAGALAGALGAATLHEPIFRRIAAIMLLGAAATVFVNSKRWSERRPDPSAVRPWHHAAVFLMAAYGGFLQIGLGIVLLAFLVLAAGFDVVRGNALKSGLVLVFQLVALVVFTRADQIDWPKGLVLAVGSAIGGAVGAHTVMRAGTHWIRLAIVLAALAGVVKLVGR